MSMLSYSTGTVTSLTALQTAIVNACTAKGWTWNATNSTLAKGGHAVSLIMTTGAGVLNRLRLLGGTGVDGSGVLQNPGPTQVSIFDGLTGPGGPAIVYPATYRIFIYDSPNAVFVDFNHDTVKHQWFIFGEAINLGCTGVSGVIPFYHGTFFDWTATGNQYGTVYNDGYSNSIPASSVPFMVRQGFYADGQASNSFAYINEPNGYGPTNTPTAKWAMGGNGGTQGTAANFCQQVSCYNANGSTYSTQRFQPNLWNGDAALSPIRPMARRPSGFYSYAFEIPHCRLIRNDYYNDFDVVTRGSDQWMVIACRKKDLVNRENAAASVDSSGTYALAMEYAP